MSDRRPTILLNPGPVTLTERVRSALTREDQCHREPEFARLTLGIRERLARVYPEAQGRYEAVLLAGSGTCAVEAMLSSLAPREDKTLVLSNGVYGERIEAILALHGKPAVVARFPWTSSIDLGEVERRLDAEPAITHVAAVHNETTTGRLNDLERLGPLCRARSLRLLLDGVSSFAGECLAFDAWNLAAVAATANKCLHGAPGISFVLADSALLASGGNGATTLYLDLFRYRAEQLKGSSPYTLATHACFALDEALSELEEQGGWPARHARYLALSTRIRGALAALGVRPLLEDGAYSSMISSFHLPEGFDYARLHDGLKAAGFVIYAGQGALARSIFRIANMGDVRDEDVERLIGALSRLLGR